MNQQAVGYFEVTVVLVVTTTSCNGLQSKQFSVIDVEVTVTVGTRVSNTEAACTLGARLITHCNDCCVIHVDVTLVWVNRINPTRTVVTSCDQNR